MRSAAIFDLDGTLIQGTSAERLLVPWLVKKGVIGARQLTSAVALAAACPFIGRTRALRRNKRWLSGVAVDAVTSRLGMFLDEVVTPRWCTGVLARMGELRALGHAVFLLSGAPAFIVEAVGARLQADGVVATPMEVRGDVFTGRLGGTHVFAAAKLTALRTLAREKDLDLAASWGFADHLSDVPFLEAFGHPVVVSPSRELRKVAEERGWEMAGCDRTGRDGEYSSAAPFAPR
ncbi:MAG: HAD-IB family hydrolase [Gemmatimonadota bacterium]